MTEQTETPQVLEGSVERRLAEIQAQLAPPVVETPQAEETPAPVVETPVETPAPVVAETPAPVVVDTPVSNWLDDTTPAPAVQADTNAPAQTKSKYDTLIESNPELKYVVEAISSGKKLSDITSEYKVVDYSKEPADKVLREYGKLHGLTDEEIADDLDSLNSLTKLQILEKRRTWEQALNQDQDRKLKTLTATYQKTPDQIAQEQAALEQAEKQFQSELDKQANFLIDKELFNTRFTEADANEFKQWVQTFNLYDEKGQPDYAKLMPRLMRMYLGDKKLSAIQASVNAKAKEQGKTEGIQEIKKELERVNENSAAVSRPPAEKQAASELDHAKAHLKQTYGIQPI